MLEITRPCGDPVEVFSRINKTARRLGFDYCTVGFEVGLPMTTLAPQLLSNYPEEWQTKYKKHAYWTIDPVVTKAKKSRAPFSWKTSNFVEAPEIMEEASASGINMGWTQSEIDGSGVASMLTLARSHEEISPLEIKSMKDHWSWLLHVSHLSLSQAIRSKQQKDFENIKLHKSEIEVLKWIALGKSSSQIAEILQLSPHTINTYMYRVVQKIGVANRTSAVIKTVAMGLLSP